MAAKHFTAWRDPVFLTCAGLWALGKYVLRPNFNCFYLHAYWNDFLCAGIAVPLVVTLTQKLRLRAANGPPTALEIAVPLCVIAYVFELYLPFRPVLQAYNISDPADILAYVLGGIVAYIIWNVSKRFSS